MSKNEIRLLVLACTFIGIVIGFLLAPIKKGQIIYCGNNSGNDNGNNNSARLTKADKKSCKEKQKI